MFVVQETIIVYWYLSYNCKFWNGSSVYTVFILSTIFIVHFEELTVNNLVTL